MKYIVIFHALCKEQWMSVEIQMLNVEPILIVDYAPPYDAEGDWARLQAVAREVYQRMKQPLHIILCGQEKLSFAQHLANMVQLRQDAAHMNALPSTLYLVGDAASPMLRLLQAAAQQGLYGRTQIRSVADKQQALRLIRHDLNLKIVNGQ
jgi:hypothetical protein